MDCKLTAEKINSHLSNGGVVQIATYQHSTIYKQAHAGMFFTGKDGNLYVKRGKQSDCLSFASGEHIAVGIRLGQLTKPARS